VFGELLASVRRDLLRVVNGEASHECILFASSGTGAIEACITSIVPASGSILILENGAYGQRMAEICNANGIEYETLQFDWTTPIDPAIVESRLAHDHQFSAVAFVHHETTAGIMNPLQKLLSVSGEHNLPALVDAMSSYAGIPLDLQESSIDFLVASSNKCLQGVAGLGFVLAKRESLERTRNFPPRNLYFNLIRNFDAQSTTGQFAFTAPVQLLQALQCALDEYFDETQAGRSRRYLALYEKISVGMESLGFECLIRDSFIHSRLITTYTEPDWPGFSFEGMHDFLFARGITIYPGKIPGECTFRIGNIGAISERDIETFLTCVAEYVNGISESGGHEDVST
jgi:2-aminoethylphosphonate aminotransferase